MTDLFSIAGKTALVTGGSRGIGKMIATGFVEAGAKVYVSSRKADACDELAAELSAIGECEALPADLSTEPGCRMLAAALAERESLLHILVNNAGNTWGAPFEEFDDAAWDRVLSLNVKGVFHTTKFLTPLLRAASSPDDPARVINIGSIDGIAVSVLESYSYGASKAAVHQLTRHLAKRLAPAITVNAIAPGPFDSKMMAATLAAFGEQIAAGAPLRRIGRPDDMAGAAIFLASRAGAYLTGPSSPSTAGSPPSDETRRFGRVGQGGSMRVSTMLDYSRGIKESADHVAELERAGLDIVWVAEAYGLDGPSQMGYIAAKTERVEIGSAILPIYSRTPALLAQTAAGIDALSDGRFILGLGASGPQVIEGWHGVSYDRPLERTREIIEICRRVWRREVLTNEGLYPIPLPPGLGTGLGKPLKLINHPVRQEIPIWVASMGPKNVEMTAELADGWFPFLFIPERAHEVWGDALGAGAAKRSPQRARLDIAAGGLVAVGDGLEHLRELARPMTALYVGGMGARGRNFYNALTCRYGFEAEAQLIQDLYLGGKKDEAAAAVPDELLELTSLVGPPGYVKERIAAYREAGVTVLNVTPVGPDPLAVIEQLRGWCS